jgi:hypothetical protein
VRAVQVHPTGGVVGTSALVSLGTSVYREDELMRPPPSTPARQLAQRIFAHELAARAAERAAVEATFSRLVGIVATLVGHRGCGAVLARAVRLSAAVYPWLALPDGDVDAAAVTAAVCSRVDEDGGPAAVVVAAEVLAHVLDLLAGFIGADLTFRLVRREWPDLQGDNP